MGREKQGKRGRKEVEETSRWRENHMKEKKWRKRDYHPLLV